MLSQSWILSYISIQHISDLAKSPQGEEFKPEPLCTAGWGARWGQEPTSSCVQLPHSHFCSSSSTSQLGSQLLLSTPYQLCTPRPLSKRPKPSQTPSIQLSLSAVISLDTLKHTRWATSPHSETQMPTLTHQYAYQVPSLTSQHQCHQTFCFHQEVKRAWKRSFYQVCLGYWYQSYFWVSIIRLGWASPILSKLIR